MRQLKLSTQTDASTSQNTYSTKTGRLSERPVFDPLPTAPGWLLSRHVGEAPLAVGLVWEEEEEGGRRCGHLG